MPSRPNPPTAGVQPAQAAIQTEALLAALPGWSLSTSGGQPALQRRWRLPDFAAALALAHALGELAERLRHHPELALGWGWLVASWTTHDAGGITALDERAARESDAIAARLGAEPA